MFLIKSVLGLKKYPYTMISQKTNIIHQHKKSKFLFFIFLLTIYFVCLLMHAQISNVRTFYIKMGISNLIYVDTSFVDEQIANVTNIKWIPAKLENDQEIVIGSNIILKLFDVYALEKIKKNISKYFENINIQALTLKNYYKIETPTPTAALQICEILSSLSVVEYAYPEISLNLLEHNLYAPIPNDKYWQWNWHIDQRNELGHKTKWDMNVLSAWGTTKGESSSIVIMDTGIQSDHPDLIERLNNNLHYNVFTKESSPDPLDLSYIRAHGTGVAGLAAASAYNGIGTCGISPESDLIGFVMLQGTRKISDLELSELYLRANQEGRIQNQSWGYESRMRPLTDIERNAIYNATHNENGVIMVRSAGNSRTEINDQPDYGDANNEARNTLQTSVVVAAVDFNGQYASYSCPGACVLVAAPGGDSNEEHSFLTTDFTGTKGFNYINYFSPYEDYNNYISGDVFFGTSSATPIISGVCGLILSANPDLTARDVRHILIQSSQQVDEKDPDIKINGAGFKVSHNCGYGVPDAGHAVTLAKNWNHLKDPSTINDSIDFKAGEHIPSMGYALKIFSEDNIEMNSIPFAATDTVFPDNSSPLCKIIDLGLVTEPIEQDITGCCVLIERGEITFKEKIDYAAERGAVFVIIYNNETNNDLINMGSVDRCTVPAIFISGNSAETIKKSLNAGVFLKAQLFVNPWSYSFKIDDTLISEDVSLKINASSSDCGMLRISLISPSGTRSILNRYHFGNTQEIDWEFLTTHHFYEPAKGDWKIEIVNFPQPGTGVYTDDALIHGLSLTITGMRIQDDDNNGLDDTWELTHLGKLGNTASDIISESGYSNARWQIVGDQTVDEACKLTMSANILQPGKLRIGWHGVDGYQYDLFEYSVTSKNWSLIDVIPGQFPTTESVIDIQNNSRENFYYLRKRKI